MTDSVCIPTATILSDRWKKLKPSTRCVFLAMLSKKEPDNGVVEWINAGLAAAAGVALKTAISAISDLCGQGFIEVKIKGGRWQNGTVYEISQDYLDIDSDGQLQAKLISRLPVGKGLVYFIGNIEHGVVKIGFSKHPPAKRIEALQTGCPYELSVLKTIKGTTLAGESLIQKRFQKCKLNGEWFSIEEDLADYLGV